MDRVLSKTQRKTRDARSFAAPQDAVAGLAYGFRIRLVLEAGLRVAVRGMPRVTAHAGSRVRVYGLPSYQELVEVVIETSPDRNLSVAFEAIIITNWHGELRRLDGGAAVPGQRVVSAEQFCAHAPGYADTGMAVNTPDAFGRVKGSQIGGLSRGRALKEGRFRLSMARSAERVMFFLGGGERESARSQNDG